MNENHNSIYRNCNNYDTVIDGLLAADKEAQIITLAVCSLTTMTEISRLQGILHSHLIPDIPRHPAFLSLICSSNLFPIIRGKKKEICC